MIQESLLSDSRDFMKSRIILTAAELDMFTILHGGSLTAKELAMRLGLDQRATTRVLDCLVAFGLLEKDPHHYRLSEKGVFLSARHPETALPMVLHMNHLWDRWSTLTKTLEKGPGATKKSGLKFTDRDWKAFVGAMHVAARDISMEIAGTYNTEGLKRLLDVGGASGTYTIAFLKKNPDLKGVIFDFPEVIIMAEERVAAEGLADRVECVSGDFYHDELPAGCDFALLSAIIHQNSVEENEELYRKIHAVLEPGGTILIRDHIMDESRTKPAAGAVFAINMLVNTHGGDTYTYQEIKEGLERAGFVDVRLIQMGEKMDSLVEAKKPF